MNSAKLGKPAIARGLNVIVIGITDIRIILTDVKSQNKYSLVWSTAQ